MSDDKNMFHVEQHKNVSRETSQENPSACPGCGNKHYAVFCHTHDYSITKEPFTIIQCTNCFLKQTYPIPQDIDRYYDSSAYVSHSNTKQGIINKLYHIAQWYNLRYKYSAIPQSKAQPKWLDYGSGAGAFLKYCKQRGVSIAGVEPHEPSRSACRAIGLDVLTTEEYLQDRQHFDVITMWHVLEHVPDLAQILAKHYQSLQPSGLIIIAVPNPASHDATHYREHWAAWDVPRHLWHFEEKQLTALLEKHKFKHVKTLGMPFDAIYISLLSEKYKNGSFLKGLLVATASRIKYLLKLTPDSSQVYIFQKTP